MENNKPQTIYLTIPFESTRKIQPDGSIVHTMSMRYEGCSARLTSGEKQIGEVAGMVGGGIELRAEPKEGEAFPDNAHQYRARPKAIWNAFVEAIERPELIIK